MLEQVLKLLFQPPGPPPLEWPSAVRLAPPVKRALMESVAKAVELAYFAGAKDGFLYGFGFAAFLSIMLWLRVRGSGEK